jgi:hypothetical protein
MMCVSCVWCLCGSEELHLLMMCVSCGVLCGNEKLHLLMMCVSCVVWCVVWQ